MAVELPGISVAFIGPQGCGKTTAVSNLCQLHAGFPEDAHGECRNLAKELGCYGCQHSWMLDTLKEERESGRSIVPNFCNFRTSHFAYTAIDSPGSEGLNKNMICITSLADIAVLLVSAADGEWEDNLDSGRVRELALTCFTMGIKNVAVWVTKMDHQSVTDNAQARFEDIKKVTTNFLKEVGYKQKEGVQVVPISGAMGDNLFTKSSELDWYNGKTAVESLDALGPISRPAEKPLRFPVLSVREQDEAGTIITGRVETGSVRAGLKLVFSPSGYVGEISSVHKNGEDVGDAKSGDVVSVSLADSIPADRLRRGMVASEASNDPAAETEHLIAQVVILDHPGSIRPGYCPYIAVHTAQVPCEFEELVSVMDRKTKESKPNPSKVVTGEVVTVKMRPRIGVCLEPFAVYPSLGRFAVRDNGKTIGVGVVKDVVKRPIPPPKDFD